MDGLTHLVAAEATARERLRAEAADRLRDNDATDGSTKRLDGADAEVRSAPGSDVGWLAMMTEDVGVGRGEIASVARRRRYLSCAAASERASE